MSFGPDAGRNPRTDEDADDGSPAMPTITPNLWFDAQGLEAAEFYVSIFPNSKVTDITHYGESGPRPAGTVLTVNFELDGQPYTAINGGPEFTFDEAISLLVNCADRDEVDYYWEKLSEGGEEGVCGWLKDKFGLSWQVCPVGFEAMVNSPNKEGAERAMQAMFGMKKLDLAALQAAFDGK
jgi:predicted 3-demethylubiquinone-9 3-methyltransferase (glyoxalase superfamily)